MASSLPLELLGPIALGIDSPIVLACRLNRLLRMRRLYTCHARRIRRLSRPARLTLAWAMWLLLAHFIGCAWWSLGVFESRRDDEAATAALLANASSAAAAVYESSGQRVVRTPWPRRAVTLGGTVRLWPEASLGQAYWSSLYWALTCWRHVHRDTRR